MEKRIYDEFNGLWYELRGDYYFPCITVLKGTPIGLWGKQHLNHLRKHRPVVYNCLLTEGKLNDHLATIDRNAISRMDVRIQQTKETHGITEQLKAIDKKAVSAMDSSPNNGQ